MTPLLGCSLFPDDVRQYTFFCELYAYDVEATTGSGVTQQSEFFMQSMEALHERRWKDYPHLDQLLSGNQPSINWTGPTSVSSNIFNRVNDLLHVYALVDDQHKEIRQQCFKADDHGLRHDMESLSENLRVMSEFFKDASYRVDHMK